MNFRRTRFLDKIAAAQVVFAITVGVGCVVAAYSVTIHRMASGPASEDAGSATIETVAAPGQHT